CLALRFPGFRRLATPSLFSEPEWRWSGLALTNNSAARSRNKLFCPCVWSSLFRQPSGPYSRSFYLHFIHSVDSACTRFVMRWNPAQDASFHTPEIHSFPDPLPQQPINPQSTANQSAKRPCQTQKKPRFTTLPDTPDFHP